MALLQILFTYMPFMNSAFHSKPILPIDWAFILGAGLVIFLLMELEKKMQFKTNGRSR
jgi:cation-transporting ATPase F